jgi:ribonuclease I
VAVAVGALAAWYLQRDHEKTDESEISVGVTHEPRRGGVRPLAANGFDFYLLAMTLHPAFCAEHARKAECRTGEPVPLSIHGLWPESLQPGTYPRDCAGPALDLDPGLALELAPLMPGMADDLHVHEWRSHGTCSGLADDEYFRQTLELARRIDRVLRAKLTTLAGQSTSASELRALAEQYDPGLARSLTFHCRTLREAPSGTRGQAYLVEIRQCVDDDGPDGAPRTLLDCASVNRRDQGCGREFQIAEARR